MSTVRTPRPTIRWPWLSWFGSDFGGRNPWETAINDLDRMAMINGISPLGETIGSITLPLSQFPLFSVPVGQGWWGYTNWKSGFTTFENRGLGFRFRANPNEVAIELDPGTKLPAGPELAVKEVCHYY